jgi:FkbM family methyltransferase
MIKRAVRWTLGVLGYRLSRIGPAAYGLENFFPLLKRYGLDPKHIVDVGANRGNWTREATKHFPRAHYTLVEPQDELKIHVRDLVERGYQIQWINAGVSDQAGVFPLQVHADSISSTFRQVSSYVRQIPVQVRTLNEIVSSTGLPIPEMVKIDTEGFDLKVLAGASELLGKTEIFMTEAGVVADDIDNTALAMMQTMADVGYRLIDIIDLNRSPKHGVLWLCDLAFLLKTSHLLQAATSY